MTGASFLITSQRCREPYVTLPIEIMFFGRVFPPKWCLSLTSPHSTVVISRRHLVKSSNSIATWKHHLLPRELKKWLNTFFMITKNLTQLGVTSKSVLKSMQKNLRKGSSSVGRRRTCCTSVYSRT